MRGTGLVELTTPAGKASRSGAQLVKGEELPPLQKGLLTSSHIVRWCAAQQNWDKIHYDLDYARDVAKLPGTIINGALKQHLITQFLTEAFDGDAWIWRLDYRFAAMDFVGQALEVRGRIAEIQTHRDQIFVTVDVAIFNCDLKKSTTTGTAIVVYPSSGGARLDAMDVNAPAELRLDQSVRSPDPATPANVRAKLGSRLEYVESDYAIDLSRLRLFADAVGGLRPVHYDPECSQAKAIGGVVGTPLFPLHALEGMPGSRPLSLARESMGREGVNEVGRDMARHFGTQIAWNGGNKVEVYALAKVGERVAAESVLAAAFTRVGRIGGPMLLFETVNRYGVVNGRPLMTERQTMICRLSDDGGTG